MTGGRESVVAHNKFMRDEDNECRVYMRLARFPRLVQARHNAKTAAGVGGLTLERCRPTCTTAASAHMVWLGATYEDDAFPAHGLLRASQR